MLGLRLPTECRIDFRMGDVIQVVAHRLECDPITIHVPHTFQKARINTDRLVCLC